MGKRSRPNSASVSQGEAPAEVSGGDASLAMQKPRRRLISKQWTPVLVIVLVALIGIESFYVYRWFRVQSYVTQARESLAKMDYDAAEKSLVLAAAFKPNDPAIMLEFAAVNRIAERAREFDSWIENAQRAGADPEAVKKQVLLMRTQEGFVKKDTEEFQQLLALGEQSDNDAAQVYYSLAKGYFASYEVRLAEDAINSWLTWQPDSVPARFLRGNIRYRYGQVEQAIADYRFVIEQVPQHAEAHFLLGLLLNESGRMEEAREHFERAVELDSDSVEFKLELAFCVKQLGDDAKARELAEQIIASKDAPRRGKAMELLAKLAIEAEDYEQARQLLENAFRIAPANAELCHMMGTVLSLLDQPEQAQRFMAEAQGFRERHERTQDLIKQLIDEPARDDLRLEVAELMFRDGLDEAASMWLVTILRRTPDHLRSHQLLAAYYQRTGRSELAAAHRAKAEELIGGAGASPASAAGGSGG